MSKFSIVVIGGINLDIGARPFEPLIDRDSNPGRVVTSLGGVGRNIAHNLHLLGQDPVFLGAVGTDFISEQVEKACVSHGIDMSHVRHVEGASPSTYVYIADEKGDMAVAVSDMRICDTITVDYIRENLDLIQKADMVIMDTNIPEETIAYVIDNAAAPVMVDPVSVTKSRKLSSHLKGIHTLKPNLPEAEALSGVQITDEATLRFAAKKLLDQGVRRVFLSLGSHGVLAVEEGRCELVPVLNVHLTNATGGGDAFMAAICLGTLLGKDLMDIAAMGMAAAKLTIESPETVDPNLSLAAIEAVLLETNS